jgi:hypothetical protein
MQVDWAAFRRDAVPDLTGVRYLGYGEFRPSIFLTSLFEVGQVQSHLGIDREILLKVP